MKRFKLTTLATALGLCTLGFSQSHATELEVTHWWTSGGEAAAVKVFADAYNGAVTHGLTVQSPAVAVRPGR